MSTGPDISLPRFEGPLDLLLDLVRKNEVDIQDIPIAEITRQYLEHLKRAEELDVELNSEFAYIASVLIHIKSRCLLARDPEIAREEDPRQELVRMLLDHEQVRQGAEFLKQKLEIAEASWSKSGVEQELAESAAPLVPPRNGTLNLFEVLRLAQQALNTARVYEIVTPTDAVSVDEMIAWLEERLSRSPGPADVSSLLAQLPTPQHQAALFLGILEMAKAARVRLDQRSCFGPLYIDAVLRTTCASQ